MTTGTEQERTVRIAEWSVVGISCNGVGAWLLLREGDVVADAVFRSVEVELLCYALLEHGQMVVAHREVYGSLAVAGGIECAFHQVLFHRSAWTFRILVEQKHALWQLAVVQSVGIEHVASHILISSVGDELLHSSAEILPACVVECVVEGKFLNVVEILLLKVCCRYVVVSISKGKHILEHSRCRSRSRNELHDAMALCLVLLPCLFVLFHVGFCRGDDAFSYTGSCLEFEEGESCLKLFEL